MTEERKEYIITKVEKNQEKDKELEKEIKVRKRFIAIFAAFLVYNAGSLVAKLTLDMGMFNLLWNLIMGTLCGSMLYAEIKLKKDQEIEKKLNEKETQELLDECVSEELEKTLGLKK